MARSKKTNSGQVTGITPTIGPELDEKLRNIEEMPDGLGGLRLLCSEIREAIASGDVNKAVTKALTLGNLCAGMYFVPYIVPEAKRTIGKQRQKQAGIAEGLEDCDRMKALVDVKGMTEAQARKKIAEERNLSLREIQKRTRNWRTL